MTFYKPIMLILALGLVGCSFKKDGSERGADFEVSPITLESSPETIKASWLMADMLADLIAGKPLTDALTSPAADAVDGGWRGLHREAIRGSGYVVHSLQAAVWAVSRTTSFRSAVLLAANLGEDADTTAAITGQLAGAAYGLSGIPLEWLEPLAWRQRIEATADDLFHQA